MIDAEKRLLANALEDVDSQFFVLLSDRFGWLHRNFTQFFYIIFKTFFLFMTAVFHYIHLITYITI
jgi:hypothetical protein